MGQNNISVSIQTLSTNPNSMIVSLTATRFNFTDDVVDILSLNIDPVDSKKYGLVYDSDTMEFWKSKPVEAKVWKSNQKSLYESMSKFIEFCGVDKYTKLFAQDKKFTFPIIENSICASGLTVPWRDYNLIDMSSLMWCTSFNKSQADRIGRQYVSMDESVTQISWLKSMLGLNK